MYGDGEAVDQTTQSYLAPADLVEVRNKKKYPTQLRNKRENEVDGQIFCSHDETIK